MALTNSEVKEIEVMIRKEIRGFMENNTVRQFEDKLMDKIQKSAEEWKQQLSPEEYEVARQGGTERAFTGRYWDNKEAGTYRCV